MQLLQNLRRLRGQKPNSTCILHIESLEGHHHGVRRAMRRRHTPAVGHLRRPIVVLCPPAFQCGDRSCRRKRSSLTSFFTPTDRALAALVVWVALVAVFSVDSAAFRCDVRSLTSNVALHGPENGRLDPPGSVALGRFLRQEVQIIGRLGGQAHCNDGFSIRHDGATL